MTANFSRKMIEFIDKRNISFRTIQRRTGMSLANIKIFKSDPNYGLTISWMTRLLAAFRKERMAEHIFENMPMLQNYIFAQPKAWNLLTEEDLLKFDIIMHDFFLKDSEAYFKLLDLFYVLKSMCSNTKKTKTAPNTVTFKDVQEKRARYLSEIEFLEEDLSSFFLTNPERNFEPNDYSNTTTKYPDREFDEFTDMLTTGETFTWTDVAAYITKIQKQTGLSAEMLNKKIGLSSDVIIRMETQKAKSFRVNDIFKIDNYFEMDGEFASMCIRAAQNSIIAADIMKEVDSILCDHEDDPNRTEKNNRNNQFNKAVDSFICMIRYIQSLNGYTGFFDSFITGFRNHFSYNDKDNQKLNIYTDFYFQFISSSNPLIYYRFPKF